MTSLREYLNIFYKLMKMECRIYVILFGKRESGLDKWKLSHFIPIYKKGSKMNCDNYRTIPLISHVSNLKKNIYLLGYLIIDCERL